MKKLLIVITALLVSTGAMAQHHGYHGGYGHGGGHWAGPLIGGMVIGAVIANAQIPVSSEASAPLLGTRGRGGVRRSVGLEESRRYDPRPIEESQRQTGQVSGGSE